MPTSRWAELALLVFSWGGRERATLWRFRADLPEVLIEQLKTLCMEEPAAKDLRSSPRHFEVYLRLLGTHATLQELWMGPAYHLGDYFEALRPVVAITKANAEMLGEGFEKLLDEMPEWQPFLAMVVDGRAVSVCRSVRITAEAHEAGVEKLPEFRGRGFARDAVAAWARSVHAMGAMPLYSTSWENTASQAVPKKLRLVQYGTDFQAR